MTRLGVRLAVLFGSRARGTNRPDSDTDIGVVIDGPIPGLMDPMRSRIIEALGEPPNVDLVFLDQADPLLLFEAARNCVLVYQALQGEIELFRLRAFKRYMDTAWIRHLEAEALRQRLA
jgi:predicted nucleotidyltransferase